MENIIRPWQPGDAPALARFLDNPHILDNLRDGLPSPYTEDDAREFISAMLAAEPGNVFAFAITQGGECVGSISAARGTNVHRRTAELGYYVAEPYWGRGLCTAAVKAACAHVFAHSDILRIYAEPFAHNAASCRVLEKAGFVYEGTLRANAVKTAPCATCACTPWCGRAERPGNDNHYGKGDTICLIPYAPPPPPTARPVPEYTRPIPAPP